MAYRYDPDLAPVIDLLPTLDITELAAARTLIDEIAAQSPQFVGSADVGLATLQVPVDGADTPVTLYALTPGCREALSPCVVWFHGGGFVLGAARHDLASNARIAERLGTVVVSVDYRLAPEYPYPAAVNDGFAALKWVADHAADLGIDPARLAVAGESAGACLAAAMTLMARDAGGPGICFQALDIPVTDDRLQTPSMRQFTDTPLWTRKNAELSWAAYLGTDFAGDAPAYAAPARADDLRALPPAFISACEYDPLRDEALEYGQRLVAAGVSTEMHLYPGTFHGSASAVSIAEVSVRMRHDLTSALAQALRTGSRMGIEV